MAKFYPMLCPVSHAASLMVGLPRVTFAPLGRARDFGGGCAVSVRSGSATLGYPLFPTLPTGREKWLPRRSSVWDVVRSTAVYS